MDESNGLTLTPAEVETVRRMVQAWIGEGFTTPPYKPEVYDVFEKLGIYESFPYDVKRPSS